MHELRMINVAIGKALRHFAPPFHAIVILKVSLCICALLAGGAVAQEDNRVIVRTGRHVDFVRIVFIASDGVTQQALVKRMTGPVLQVIFPRPVEFMTERKGPLGKNVQTEMGPGVTIIASEDRCTIMFNQMSTHSVSRLTTPPRLVIDVYTGAPVHLPQQAQPEKPAAAPPQPEAPPSPKTVVIDAGHGGVDHGLQGEGFMEKNLVLALSKDLSQALTKKGKRVQLTRKSDQRLPLRERIRFVRRTAPDMVISIHLSRRGDVVVYTAPAGDGGEAANERQETKTAAGRGIETTVTGNIVQNLKRDLNLTVRQEKLPLPMLNRVQTPALLIELPSPDLFKYDEAAKARLIQAIAGSL